VALSQVRPIRGVEAMNGVTKRAIELEADVWDSLSDGEPDGTEMRAYQRGIADGLRRALSLLAREKERP